MKYIFLVMLVFSLDTFAAKKCYHDWTGKKICEEEEFSDAVGGLLANMFMISNQESQKNAKKLKGILIPAKTPKNNNWSQGLISTAPIGE